VGGGGDVGTCEHFHPGGGGRCAVEPSGEAECARRLHV
jgi:hypothetical protein